MFAPQPEEKEQNLKWQLIIINIALQALDSKLDPASRDSKNFIEECLLQSSKIWVFNHSFTLHEI